MILSDKIWPMDLIHGMMFCKVGMMNGKILNRQARMVEALPTEFGIFSEYFSHCPILNCADENTCISCCDKILFSKLFFIFLKDLRIHRVY